MTSDALLPPFQRPPSLFVLLLIFAGNLFVLTPSPSQQGVARGLEERGGGKVNIAPALVPIALYGEGSNTPSFPCFVYCSLQDKVQEEGGRGWLSEEGIRKKKEGVELSLNPLLHLHPLRYTAEVHPLLPPSCSPQWGTPALCTVHLPQRSLHSGRSSHPPLSPRPPSPFHPDPSDEDGGGRRSPALLLLLLLYGIKEKNEGGGKGQSGSKGTEKKREEEKGGGGGDRERERGADASGKK